MDTLAPLSIAAPPARRLFTAADLERMFHDGILNRDERVELIGGDIITMAAKGNFHEIMRGKLTQHWARHVPVDLDVFGETPLRLSETDNPEPDIIVFPSSISLPDVRGNSVLLVVEISDSSLGYDLGIKSRLYASFGVREYWVIHAEKLETHVHRRPVNGEYADLTRHGAGDAIVPLLVPALTTRLADFQFNWMGDGA